MKGIVCVCVCVCLQAFYYPPDAGMPMGGPGSSRFLRLEVHYHNPLLISGTYRAHVNTHALGFFLVYTVKQHSLCCISPDEFWSYLQQSNSFKIFQILFDLARTSHYRLCLPYPDLTLQYTYIPHNHFLILHTSFAVFCYECGYHLNASFKLTCSLADIEQTLSIDLIIKPE